MGCVFSRTSTDVLEGMGSADLPDSITFGLEEGEPEEEEVQKVSSASSE